MSSHSAVEIDLDDRSLGKTRRTHPEDINAEPRKRLSGSKTLLFVTNASGFGGTEKHLLELVKRLAGSRVQSVILQTGVEVYTDRAPRNESLDVSVQTEKIGDSLWSWFRFFRKARPDIVVFVNSWIGAFPWYSPIAACLARVPKRFGIQHLIAYPLAKIEGWSMRDVLRRVLGYQQRKRLAFGLSASCCNATICVSDAVRDRLVTDYGFPPNKTTTIRNGISVSEFVPSQTNRASVRARLGLSSDEFLLVCVARLTEDKGIDILLSAVARVLGDGLRCKCIIVGDGPLGEALSEQARALGLRDHVFFEGFQQDVLPFLQTASAFVLTSHIEGLPLSILEAMACGLPCIVTNVGGNAEAVHHMVHGLVVAPNSAEEVAGAISYLVTHPRELAEMSTAGRNRVRDAFDVEDRMEDIKRVILS
jgi:glycosyltransferase involved in cell wall biosynthesis